MAKGLILGPILGVESDSLYTVTLVTDKAVTSTEINYLTQGSLSHQHHSVRASKIGDIYSGQVWRAELHLAAEAAGSMIEYQVRADGDAIDDKAGLNKWQFYLPSMAEKPKFAYVSCNGFSDYKLMTSTEQPYALWEQMAIAHRASPFSLLLMGGDQVYADSIWSQLSSLKTWNDLGRAEKIKRKATREMRGQIDRFYSELYVDRWNKQPMAALLASVPSLMMWDDHDIIDGWGSYPEDIQQSDVYQAIFASAKKHFALLQLRGSANTSLIAANTAVDGAVCPQPVSLDGWRHFSSLVRFRGYQILSLDNRSQRSITQVMDSAHWQDVASALAEQCGEGDLLVLSAVPVVYRDFSFAESAVDATPWEEEITDDLKDHWRAKEHEGERLKLVMRLLNNAIARKGKTVILSGDVHVGCLGIIRDKRGAVPVNIHQVVSSGIVHPAPSYLQWLGILAVTNDDLEYLDETRLITADMIKPHGSNKYIRSRNFVTLQEGTDAKLWVNWICEGKDQPSYPLL